MKQLEPKLQNGQNWEGVIYTNSKWGSSVTVYCEISPVFDNDNKIVNTIAVCKEVSYEAALQDALLSAKKLEAVGRLSANFSHEFGNALIFCISDTGRNIKKEHQELVLEPFFSTKTEVEGAGLGLSVAYGTMKSIGGTITFSSVVDEGSHFFVRVPFCC